MSLSAARKGWEAMVRRGQQRRQGGREGRGHGCLVEPQPPVPGSGARNA